MPLLEVSHLHIAINGSTRLVEDVSFSIREGETFALLGESGCGKSMTALALMKLLPGGVRIAEGGVTMNDVDLLSLPERDMCKVRGGSIGMIFQEPGLSLNPVMTVGEQIMEVLALHHGLHIADATLQATEMLRQVGIPDPERRLGEYPFQLSGGMKQRVMIAMALAGNPRLLIADEPTTALDVTIQAQVLQLLRDTQVAQGMAMLLITHDLGVVAQMAQQVGVMYAGQIVELAARDQLFDKPLHPYTQKLFAALPDVSRKGQALTAIPGSVPAPGELNSGCRFAARCDRAWSACHDTVPEWTMMQDGRGVRCHLYGQDRKQEAEDILQSVQHQAGVSVSATVSADEQANILEVENLKVHFPIRKGLLQRMNGAVKAVDGVSFSISRGRSMALVGESGCGKTTVGKALLQLIQPLSGRVKVNGVELSGLEAREARNQRRNMQMVFQDPYASLNPKMRIAEILQEGMDALSVGKGSEARQKAIDELLQHTGLPRSAKWRYPHEFSGGQRQRIAIARALAVNPQLLICDEPTSALDVSVQAQILNILNDLQKTMGLSYLFITHNLAVVEYIAHEVCVMYLGRIVEHGSVEEVMRSPAHPYTQALISAVPRIGGDDGRYIRLAGEMPSSSSPPGGCHFHPRCIHAIATCRETYPEPVQISNSHVASCHLLSVKQ